MNIDYSVIERALKHYQTLGYTYIDVPWLVNEEAARVTSPPAARQFDTFAGFLPASGEQAFIHMRLAGDLPDGMYVCATPCFRDESEQDLRTVQTRTSFFKVELIHILSTETQYPAIYLDRMVSMAKEFMFWEGVDVRIIPSLDEADRQTYDLVAPYGQGQLELGSYGMRKYKDFMWFYGTGVAEPRFSIAKQIKRLSDVKSNFVFEKP